MTKPCQPCKRAPAVTVAIVLVGLTVYYLARNGNQLLRKALLYLGGAPWAKRLVTQWPLAWKMASRFVAGSTLDDAIRVTRQLAAKGIEVTLDYLGENVQKAEDALQVVEAYQSILRRIQAEEIAATISVKPTHLGLDLGEEICAHNLRQILTTAKECGLRVTIDMESSAYTERTLTLHKHMRDEGFDNVGAVIQSAIYRSEEDMRYLAAMGAHVRLCKGAYLEPATVAYAEKSDVDAAYVRLMQEFLAYDGAGYLCIATHDDAMINAALQLLRADPALKSRSEFQMLHGIRSARQEELAGMGYRMRVYVPFGTTWYPYFMRRLAERPANLWFFVKGFFSS